MTNLEENGGGNANITELETRVSELEVTTGQQEARITTNQEDIEGKTNQKWVLLEVKKFFTSADVQEKHLMDICCQNMLGFK